AQAAGEVRDSTRRLPGVFLKGIAGTTVIYALMSVVAFGVLPGAQLAASEAPMTEVGAVYLHATAAWLVTLGAVMALTTSLNATMLVPSRLGIVLARDHLAPAWLGAIHPRTGTPVRGLSLTLAGAVLLVACGQIGLALNIAVFALVLLYMLHSVALLLLPRLNPGLWRSAGAAVPLWLQRLAGIVSVLCMATLVLQQLESDAKTLAPTSLRERLAQQSLTTVELCLVWGVLGAVMYVLARRHGARTAHDYGAAFRPEAGSSAS